MRWNWQELGHLRRRDFYKLPKLYTVLKLIAIRWNMLSDGSTCE